MAGTQTPNGTSTPPVSKLDSLSLTEYATNPTPREGTPKSSVRSLVPNDFLLPNGYPDVWTVSDYRSDGC